MASGPLSSRERSQRRRRAQRVLFFPFSCHFCTFTLFYKKMSRRAALSPHPCRPHAQKGGRWRLAPVACARARPTSRGFTHVARQISSIIPRRLAAPAARSVLGAWPVCVGCAGFQNQPSTQGGCYGRTRQKSRPRLCPFRHFDTIPHSHPPRLKS